MGEITQSIERKARLEDKENMGGKNSGIQMVHTESFDLFQNHDFNFRNSPHQLQDLPLFQWRKNIHELGIPVNQPVLPSGYLT